MLYLTKYPPYVIMNYKIRGDFLIGKKFNKLTVLEECAERDNNGEKKYKCLCDCGAICYVRGGHIRTGHTKSCGCDKIIQTSHRKSSTRLYKIWDKMKQRCYNYKDSNYPNYGERGIKVYNDWYVDFMTFHDWAINNGYKSNLTIDRIDVNGNYTPDNCRWVDMITQNNNKRNTVYLTCNGKTQSVAQWSRELGISASKLYYRHSKGWNDYKCLYYKMEDYNES